TPLAYQSASPNGLSVPLHRGGGQTLRYKPRCSHPPPPRLENKKRSLSHKRSRVAILQGNGNCSAASPQKYHRSSNSSSLPRTSGSYVTVGKPMQSTILPRGSIKRLMRVSAATHDAARKGGCLSDVSSQSISRTMQRRSRRQARTGPAASNRRSKTSLVPTRSQNREATPPC